MPGKTNKNSNSSKKTSNPNLPQKDKNSQEYCKYLENLVEERTFEAKAVTQQLLNDIAGRKRIEEELRKSEERYRSVIDNIAIGVSLISHDMTILALNKQMRQWFPDIDTGEKPVCYKSFNFPSKNQVCEYCPTIKTLKDGLVHKSITETPTKNGIRNFKIISSPIKDKDGKVIMAIEMVDDITDQKTIENNLFFAKERLKTLIANIPGAVYRCALDPQWTMEFISNEIENISGYKASDFINNKIRTYASVIHPEDRKMVEEVISSAVSKKRPYTIEYRIINRNEKLHWVYEKGQAFFNAKREVICLDGAIFDITERKLAEEGLKHSKEYAELILRVTPSAIFTVDTKRRITSWNNKAEEITGYTAKDILGKECFMFAESPCKDKCGLFELKATKPIFSRECTILRKNGDRRIVLKNADYLKDDSGNIVGGIESFEDITEIKHAEERLKQAHEELVQSEKLSALGRFSSALAHEVKNPLGIIISGIEFLEKKVFDKNEEIKTAINKIKESAVRANDILETLLKAARPSQLKIENADINELLNESLALLKYLMNATKISVSAVLSKKPIHVNVDKNQVQQLLINVMLNAMEAMPAGGKISVKTYRDSETGFLLGQSNCCIEIKDEGVGIPEENMPRLFEPFFTTKFDKKGTGLGLAVAKMIIDRHKGKIQIKSEVDKGTTVKLIFPASEE